MHVCHIIEIRGIAGAENLLKDFLPALQANGYQVTCIILYLPDYEKVAVDFAAYFAGKNITAYRLKYTTLISLSACVYQISKLLKLKRPDIIHSHLRVADLVNAFLKYVTNIPVVCTIHGFKNIKKNISNTLLKCIYRRFDGAAFISNFIGNLSMQQGIVNTKCITATVYNGYTSSAPGPRSYHAKSNKKPVKIILPGRLVKFKGHQYAIEAIKYLISDHPDVELDIYGIGPTEASLRTMINDASLDKNVSLKGFINNVKTQMPEYDIVLIPSVNEFFGMVFLEAFDAEVPVVAFDLPAGNEIIVNEYNGLLAEPYSARSLAEKIQTIIDNNSLARQLTKNASVTLREKFSMAQMVSGYAGLYQKLLNRNTKNAN